MLLVGSGSAGRRYARILRARLPEAHRTLLRRPDAPPLDPATADMADRVTGDLASALDPRPDIAVIASPATTHLAHATVIADAGVPMLIEKPLSADLEGCEDLARRCAAGGVPVVVGFTLRYHPGFLALAERIRAGAIGRPLSVRAEVGQYLPDWRPGTDYRRSVTAQRALGGGALLELSHEIDLARALLGMPWSVAAHLDRVGDLEVDVEDTVEIVTHHDLGEGRTAVASIHLDLLTRPARRRLTVTGADGRLDLDFITGRLSLATPAAGIEEIPVDPVADRDELYAAEIGDLLQAVDGGRPRVGLEDGVDTQRIIDAARRSDAEGRTIELGDRP